MEAYPTLKTRIGLPALPPVALGCAALIVAALALFFIPPLILRPSSNTGAGPGASGTPSVAPSQSFVATPTPAPSQETYVVKVGDTLSAIAKKLGVSLDALLAANPQIKNPDKIQLGDELVIPSKAPSVVNDASAQPSSSGGP